MGHLYNIFIYSSSGVIVTFNIFNKMMN